MSSQILGRMEDKGNVLEVSILKSVFEGAMQDYGYQSVQVILKNWKKKGWIDYEPSRLTLRKQIFSKEQQEQRQTALGVANLPKKMADTVYTLLIPKEQIQLAVA